MGGLKKLEYWVETDKRIDSRSKKLVYRRESDPGIILSQAKSLDYLTNTNFRKRLEKKKFSHSGKFEKYLIWGCIIDISRREEYRIREEATLYPLIRLIGSKIEHINLATKELHLPFNKDKITDLEKFPRF